jgi:hypothetical protein
LETIVVNTIDAALRHDWTPEKCTGTTMMSIEGQMWERPSYENKPEGRVEDMCEKRKTQSSWEQG